MRQGQLSRKKKNTQKKNRRAHARKSKESYPNFTPSGYWTLRNRKTQALSLVGPLASDSLAVDSVSGIGTVVVSPRDAQCTSSRKDILATVRIAYGFDHVGIQNIMSRSREIKYA